MSRSDQRGDGHYSESGEDVSHSMAFIIVILLLLLVTSIVFFTGLISLPSVTIPGLGR